jgi:hypothetical protein|tara:strand:- start:749 stop:1678 length:930 start_codon:yes stop_codon:yes gene_type:complete
MPRSVYFSQSVASEQSVYEDLIIESLKIYGQDVYYIPRTIVDRDTILGEDKASKFDDAYMIEAYIENPEGFDGSGDLYQKFGLEIRDEATFIIARKQWTNLVGVWNNNVETIRPMEGDLIFLPMTNKFFEISFVEHEQPFYQLSNLPVYKLNCSLFEYNEEDFDTGVGEIDVTEIKNSYQVPITVSLTGGNHFELGEIVTQVITTNPAVSVYGTIQTLTKTSNFIAAISVSNIGVTGSTEAKDFIISPTLGLTGSKSGNTCIITAIDDVADNTSFASDGGASNNAFEADADGFLDFSENNPFGDPSETY